MSNKQNRNRSATPVERAEVMAAIQAGGSVFDMSSEEWYNEYLPGQKRKASLVVTNPDGRTQRSLTEINSDDDIIRFMLAEGFIKEQPGIEELRRQYMSNYDLIESPVPAAPVSTYVRDSFDEALDNALNAQYTPKPAKTAQAVVAAPVAVAAPVVTQKAVPKEKRAADYRAIKMEWLPDKPADPQILVKFSSDLGEFETYYHKLFYSKPIIYLVFDKRCKFGRFMPKMGGNLVTIELSGRSHQGIIWADAKVEIGVLEITPFVISPAVEQEPEQDNY